MTKDEFKKLKAGDTVYASSQNPYYCEVRTINGKWVNGAWHYEDLFFTKREAKIEYINYRNWSRHNDKR